MAATRRTSRTARTPRRAATKSAKKPAKRAPALTFAVARAIACELPGVEESTSYGTPALKVKGKLIARLKEDGETLAVKVDPEARAALIDAHPTAFFVTDHYRAYPWMLVRLGRVKRAELARLLEDAWAMTASKRLTNRR
jgi:hypothetical protein